VRVKLLQNSFEIDPVSMGERLRLVHTQCPNCFSDRISIETFPSFLVTVATTGPLA
jgi:hypothetical protein